MRTGVGDEDLCVLQSLGLVDTDFLVEDEALIEVTVHELSAGLLDDLDVVEVGGALEPEDSIDRKLRKVLLVLREDLGTQRCPRNVDEIFPELHGVVAVVNGSFAERFQRGRGGDAVAVDDGLGVDLLVDQALGLAEELGGENGHGGGSISNFVVLHLGDVHENFGGGVVEGDGFEDGGAVVGDHDLTGGPMLLLISRCVVREYKVANADCRILSMPLGPNVVFTKSPTAIAPTNADSPT